VDLVELTYRVHEPAVRELLAMSVGNPTPEKLALVCRRYATNPSWELIGCVLEGVIAGCIGVEIIGETHAMIRHLAVAPRFRRRGVARALIERLRGSVPLERVTAETDADAVAFYRRCGFTVTPLDPAYPGAERFACELMLDKPLPPR